MYFIVYSSSSNSMHYFMFFVYLIFLFYFYKHYVFEMSLCYVCGFEYKYTYE